MRKFFDLAEKFEIIYNLIRYMEGEIINYVPVINFPDDEALRIIIDELKSMPDKDKVLIISIPMPGQATKRMSIYEVIEHLEKRTPEGLNYLRLARDVDRRLGLKNPPSTLQRFLYKFKQWLQHWFNKTDQKLLTDKND